MPGKRKAYRSVDGSSLPAATPDVEPDGAEQQEAGPWLERLLQIMLARQWCLFSLCSFLLFTGCGVVFLIAINHIPQHGLGFTHPGHSTLEPAPQPPWPPAMIHRFSPPSKTFEALPPPPPPLRKSSYEAALSKSMQAPSNIETSSIALLHAPPPTPLLPPLPPPSEPIILSPVQPPPITSPTLREDASPYEPPPAPSSPTYRALPFLTFVPAPPSPPSRPPVSLRAIVAELNQRWYSGSPSQRLGDCGVLVRQFDALDNQDEGRPWEPCPSSGRWCSSFADRWAASIINKNVDKLYNTQLGGLVLDSNVSMFCVHQGDGNSMDPLHTCPKLFGDEQCIPGCYPPGEQCQDYHDYDRDWLCSYPPHMLKDAMIHQLRRGVPMHNEVQ